MTPRRYLSTAIQRLTTDNRGSDHVENMHDEIHALRKALRDMTAWNERLNKQLDAAMFANEDILKHLTEAREEIKRLKEERARLQ